MPSIAALALAFQRILPAFQGMYNCLINIGSYSDSIKQVSNNRFLLNKNFNKANNVNFELNKFDNLKVENISFRYKNKKQNAIKDINLEIKKGMFVAIKGDSGCGKKYINGFIIGAIRTQ